MTRVGLAAAVMTAAAVAAAAGSGCSRRAKSAEEAYQRLSDAVKARDGSRLFDALDLETRWSWMSTHRAHRESYDVVLSNFPEEDRDRQLRRFEAGATSDSAREMFTRSLTDRTWADLEAQLAASPAPPQVTGDGNRAESALPDGRKLIFRKGNERGAGWGYAGFADEAEQMKRRSLADLELIRSSAADYERAATRRAR